MGDSSQRVRSEVERAVTAPTRRRRTSVTVAHLRKETYWFRAMLENYVPEPNTGCWLWCGYLDKVGYARTARGRAHRVFYRHHKGDIPDGMSVLHRCDTPACVNPDHLFLGDTVTNVRDMMTKGRHRSVVPALDDVALAAIDARRIRGERLSGVAKELGFSAGRIRKMLTDWRSRRLAVGHPCPTCHGAGVLIDG